MDTSQRWVLALTAIASFMVALDGLVVTTSLPLMQRDLHASIETLQWTVNAYNLSFSVLLITGAALGDRFGRRRMFMAGILLFVAASAACALSHGAAVLIVARIVQGAGAAMVMPLAVTLVGAAYPPQQRARALGLFSGITGLAVLSGPVLGGAIAEGVAWQWIFWLNVPIGIAIALLAPRRIAESRGVAAPLDFAGLVLATGAALALVWGLTRGNAAGWASAEVLGCLVAAVVLTVAFIAWEARAAFPMIPLRFFRSPVFAAANATVFLLTATLFGGLFFLAQFFQVAQGYSALAGGLRLLPWTATCFLVAPVSGALVARLGERTLVSVGLTLQAIGLAWLAAVASPEAAYGSLILPLVVSGAGISLSIPAAQNAVLAAVAPAEVGKASGIYSTFRFLGGVVGIAVSVAVFAHGGRLGDAHGFSAGFGPAIGVCALFSLLGALTGLGLPRARATAPRPAAATAAAHRPAAAASALRQGAQS
ncbi:MAG TPA: DHA2 family efflux MFS transporter permease subunit [Burkholderiales bacterium]|nr:DHA2 family efflux MFS transporter permease subunit [Burkholderiales bacterium]